MRLAAGEKICACHRTGTGPNPDKDLTPAYPFVGCRSRRHDAMTSHDAISVLEGNARAPGSHRCI